MKFVLHLRRRTMRFHVRNATRHIGSLVILHFTHLQSSFVHLRQRGFRYTTRAIGSLVIVFFTIKFSLRLRRGDFRYASILFTEIYYLDIFAPLARQFQIHSDTFQNNLQPKGFSSYLLRGDFRHTTILLKSTWSLNCFCTSSKAI